MKKHMYKYILAALSIIAYAMSASAQDTTIIRHERRVIVVHRDHPDSTEQRDTIEVHLGGMPQIPDVDDLPNPNRKPDFVITNGSFNLGFANMNKMANTAAGPVDYNNMPELKTGGSIHIGLENSWGFNLIKGNLRLWMGLRYDILNYRFNDPDMRIIAGQPAFKTAFDSTSSSTKSKVVVNYLGVPIALGYQSNKHSVEDGFFIRAGVNAGYRVRTHSKVKYENGNKDKVFDDFNFNDVAITPFVYIGYNSIGFYARYSTTPIFKSGQGEEAYAMQFGLIIQ